MGSQRERTRWMNREAFFLCVFGLVVSLGMSARLLLAWAHQTMEGDEFAYMRMAHALVGAEPGQALTQPVLFPVLLAALHLLIPDWSWEWAGRGVSLSAA